MSFLYREDKSCQGDRQSSLCLFGQDKLRQSRVGIIHQPVFFVIPVNMNIFLR